MPLSLEQLQILVMLGGGLVTLLLSVIAFFFKGIRDDFREMTRTVQVHTTTLAVFESNIAEILKRLDGIEDAQHKAGNRMQDIELRLPRAPKRRQG